MNLWIMWPEPWKGAEIWRLALILFTAIWQHLRDGCPPSSVLAEAIRPALHNAVAPAGLYCSGWGFVPYPHGCLCSI